MTNPSVRGSQEIPAVGKSLDYLGDRNPSASDGMHGGRDWVVGRG